MRSRKLYIPLLLLLLVFGGCKKLRRDNPLDNQNPAYTQTPVTTPVPELVFSRFEITSDNNGDKKMNKGETLKLKAYIKNSGKARANNVTGKINCNSSYVTSGDFNADVFFSYLGSYSYIDPNQEGTTSYEDLLSINISPLTPDGTVLTFSLALSDDANRSWSTAFTATVVHTGAILAFERVEVYSDDNHNAAINAGETVRLKVTLKNKGTSDAQGIRALVTSTASYVTGLTPTAPAQYCYLGSTSNDYINAGQEGTSMNGVTYYPSFTVPAATPVGTVLSFNVAISDELTNTWTDTFTVTVQ